MNNESSRWASISLRPTHGTAKLVTRPSLLPGDKRDCEVFWVSTLLSHLAELHSQHPQAISNQDDSHGKHDVVVLLDNGSTIGVQVAELTYELERARKSQRDRFLAEARKYFAERDLSTHGQLLVKCFVPYVARGRYSVPSVDALANATAAFIHKSTEQKIMEVDSAQVLFEWVDKGSLYVPSVAGIGIDCDLDALPRTLDMYGDAVTYLRKKKDKSNSPWLLIWSLSFWRDKHWLGEDTLKHMQQSFSDSHFERVFFMESLDGADSFESNLTIHAIKA